MGGASLPPGFRFHPTDEELINYYLKRKSEGLKIEFEVIPVIELYKFDPWELPDKSFLPKCDMEWFFFVPRASKYPNGLRANRATKSGYWKATGKDRKVTCQSSLIGYRKTLVFYHGRAPLGVRTDWLMHEYRVHDDVFVETPNFQGMFALCRVMKKNESKTRYVTREPIAKEVGSSSNRTITEPAVLQTSTCSVETEPTSSTGIRNTSMLWVSPDLILDSSKGYSKGQEGHFTQEETRNRVCSWQACQQLEISPSSSYSNFTEEVEVVDDVNDYDGLNHFGYLSPYSRSQSLAGIFGNEDQVPYMSYGGS